MRNKLSDYEIIKQLSEQQGNSLLVLTERFETALEDFDKTIEGK